MKNIKIEKTNNIIIDEAIKPINLFEEKKSIILNQLDLILSGYSENQFSTLNAQNIEE
jgi:hypothetical protein